MVRQLLRWTILALPLVAAGCHEEMDESVLLPAAGADAGANMPAGAIQISPLDQTLDLAEVADTLNAVAFTSSDADFLMDLGQGRIYVEQNDDGQWRTANVTATRCDGTTVAITLAQPPASRAAEGEIHRNFYRHHGVGYSYEAVAGEYCNLNYVRCQLLNRAVIDKIEDETGEPFINVEYKSGMEASHSVSTSVVDYVQNSNFSADASLNLIIFEGSVSAACYAFEEGLEEKYILHDEQKYPKAHYTIDPSDIAFFTEKYPNLLTSSFRKSLKKLAATASDDYRAIDEFLEVYGTHLVYDVELGASISLDVQVDTHKFKDVENVGVLAGASLASLFKVHFEQHSEEKNYEVLRDSKCRVDVLGGDMTILDRILGMTTFSNDDIEISPEDLQKWATSIVFDDNDLEHSNVEMTSMAVLPIWYLVGDEQLAMRIESRVYSNAAELQKLLGNRNFINVKIPYSTKKYVCRVGNQKYTFTNPDVTDIIASGRHVATICQEPIPPIAGNKKVPVIYPIYEGHVKLANGLCIHNNVVYTVRWDNDSLEVFNQGEIETTKYDGNIYMNSGLLTPAKAEGLDYIEGHPIAGLERPGGIDIEGNLAGQPVRVVKYFGHFYLNNKTRYNNLPGWSYVNELPAEAEYYPSFFSDNTWKDRMVRDNNYVYILNPTEIGYE